MTRVYTKGEGEFYDLPRDEAAVRLARARDDFQRLDAPAPVGFIAPAWLLGGRGRRGRARGGIPLHDVSDAACRTYAAGEGRGSSRRNRWFTVRATPGGGRAASLGTRISRGAYAARR